MVDRTKAMLGYFMYGLYFHAKHIYFQNPLHMSKIFIYIRGFTL